MKKILGLRARLSRRAYIDQILAACNPKASLQERLEWLVDFLTWLRTPIKTKNAQEPDMGTGPLARLRFTIQLLNRHDEIRGRLAAVIRSLLDEMDAVDLFASAGIPFTHGFLYELTERVSAKFIPSPMLHHDLGEVFFNMFPAPGDVNWLSKIDDDTIEQIAKILSTPETPSIWLKLGQDVRDAMVYLAVQIQAHALNPQFRVRLPSPKLRESCFYYLEDGIKEYLGALSQSPFSQEVLIEKYKGLNQLVANGRKEVAHVRSTLDQFGANMNLIFSCDRIERQLLRIQDLVEMSGSARFKRDRHLKFFIMLIEGSAERHSVKTLFNEGLQLLTKRITERNAEVGELYISRDWNQFRKILRKAAGGGIITSSTAILKVLIESSVRSSFWIGTWSSINYAASFTFIQLAHFTLATKQPAMTATALSAKLAKVRTEDEEGEFVDETIHLVRTQFVSIAGNFITVVPAVFLLVLGFQYLTGVSALSPELAWMLIDKHSVLGPTPLYGAFTGLLLWFSSICAGFVDNWASFRQVSEGLAQSRSLAAIFGKAGAKKIALFFQNNIGGFGGNVALGFLLGLFPRILSALSIPMDVRHVTLSTGVVAFAVSSIGSEAFNSHKLTLALVGIAVVGVMNISVSFGLALWTAIRSHDINKEMKKRIYWKIVTRCLKRPWNLIFPSKR